MTLHYDYPVINTISDVLPHIDENFRVVEKEGLTFINYNNMNDTLTFPPVVDYGTAVRRECRGITFDTASGVIVSRPFQKFFNAGQRDDVSLDMIDVSRPHVVLEKLDGSMIRPLPTPYGIRWGTKMGITDVGMLAEAFVAERPEYAKMARLCMDRGLTPLFEFCSRENRIVIDYPTSTMVLLAIRDTVSGVYLPRWQVRAEAGVMGIPVVDSVDVRAMPLSEDEDAIYAVHDLNAFMQTVRDDEEGEGKIICFGDGSMVKIKGDWYVRIHRAKDMMRSERRLLELVFREEVDDLIATLPPDDRHRIEKYIESFWSEIRRTETYLNNVMQRVWERYPTKKEFALSDLRRFMPTAFHSMVFTLMDNPDALVSDVIIDAVKRGFVSETRWSERKSELDLKTDWTDIWMEDAA